MRIIKRGALEEFWRRHPDSQANLESWYGVVREDGLENARGNETDISQRGFGRAKDDFQYLWQQVPADRTS